MSQTRTWRAMSDWMVQMLEERTGQGLEEWREQLKQRDFKDEASLRRWLTKEGVDGYPQMLLVWEKFGYPSYMTASADQLIGGQYKDRPQLRPILDKILASLPEAGKDVTVQARKTYISLVSPKRTFAVIQATTKNRIDLGLRLANQKPAARLKTGNAVGNGTMTVKLGLSKPQDFDGQALKLLQRAYRENC